MSLDEETLEQVARDGGMDYEKWPAMIEPLLDRLNHIVYNDFSTPRLFPNINRPSQITTNSEIQTTTQQSNGSLVPVTPVRSLPPVPAFSSISANTTRIADSLPPSQDQQDPDQPPQVLSELPTLLLQLLLSINLTLRNTFSQNPPHTIQRLAELVLYPTKHYKTLPAWLRAVDRAVSVSSTADIFPLPHAQPLPNSVIDSSLLNGVNGDVPATGTGSGGGGILWDNSSATTTVNDGGHGYDERGLGSDESLGGALLTPIPWLKNGISGHSNSNSTSDDSQASSVDSDLLGDPIIVEHPNAANPMVPEREDGAVTQGELIRQEQEAGVVPVSATVEGGRGHGHVRMMGTADEASGEDEEGDGAPHARGPDVVGTVDMGLVDGKGVEVQIGTKKERGQDDGTEPDVNDAQNVLMGAGMSKEGEEMQVDTDTMHAAPAESGKEEDGDIVLTDVDGKTEEESEQKPHMAGENVGPDTVDTSNT